jgi:hypothetical protein
MMLRAKFGGTNVKAGKEGRFVCREQSGHLKDEPRRVLAAE